MDLEVSYNLDNEQQFWEGMHLHPPPRKPRGYLLTYPALVELEDIVSAQCESHELIDNALRAYLSFTTNFKGNRAPSVTWLQSDRH